MIAALLVTLCLVAADDAPAKAAEAKPGDATVTVQLPDEKHFPEISLTFEVKAANGEPILDAKRDEFRVLEYDKPVAITKFQSPVSREIVPTTVILVLDCSGSMKKENRIGELKRAVKAFLENLPKGSRVAVIAFSDDVELICPFTDDPARVDSAVGDLIADGQTRFYDAVQGALDLLSKEDGRRALFAMTDGDDNQSRVANLDSVIRLARRDGLPVHTLVLGSDEEVEAQDLKDLARETKGKAFSTRDAAGLSSIFEEIARNLGQMYTLSYTTDHKIPDGTLRPIQVLYAKTASVGKTAVYIRGMVAPVAGWSGLFLILVLGLGAASIGPTLLRR